MKFVLFHVYGALAEHSTITRERKKVSDPLFSKYKEKKLQKLSVAISIDFIGWRVVVVIFFEITPFVGGCANENDVCRWTLRKTMNVLAESDSEELFLLYTFIVCEGPKWSS